jgi:hypothetical protein
MLKPLKTMICLIALLAAFNGYASEKKDSTSTKLKPKSQRRAAGYMGLFDLNLSVGFFDKDRSGYQPKTSVMSGPAYSTKSSGNEIYAFFHLQESLLSNYFWADDPDKKFKVGFQETLDLGYSRGSVVSSNTLSPTEQKTPSSQFLVTYMAGLAGVYKINEDMDAGFTYYPLALSFFTESRRYGTFRFRYTNFMAEFSTFGKTAIDLKYMMRIDKDERDISFYYGLSFVGKNHSALNSSGTDRFFHISFGVVL